MSAEMMIAVFLVGFVVSALALYWIIRLAVKHAIRDTQKPENPDEKPKGSYWV